MAEPHPEVVDPQHPLIVRLRDICMAFPDAVEVTAWGRPTFRAGRRSSCSPGRHGRPVLDGVQARPRRRAGAAAGPADVLAAVLGPVGLARDRHSRPDSDWDELAELVDASYRQVALKRQLAALDAAPSCADRPVER